MLFVITICFKLSFVISFCLIYLFFILLCVLDCKGFFYSFRFRSLSAMLRVKRKKYWPANFIFRKYYGYYLYNVYKHLPLLRNFLKTRIIHQIQDNPKVDPNTAPNADEKSTNSEHLQKSK